MGKLRTKKVKARVETKINPNAAELACELQVVSSLQADRILILS